MPTNCASGLHSSYTLDTLPPGIPYPRKGPGTRDTLPQPSLAIDNYIWRICPVLSEPMTRMLWRSHNSLHKQQERIPVGCVPSAAVAVKAGGVCPGEWLSGGRGVCLRVRLHQATQLRLRLRQRYRSEFFRLHQALSLCETVLADFVYMS